MRTAAYKPGRLLFLSLSIYKNPLLIRSIFSPLGAPIHHWAFSPPSWWCQCKWRRRKGCIQWIKHFSIIIKRLGFKRISENGGETLLQASDHYLTTNTCILLHSSATNQTAFLLTLEIPFSEWVWRQTSEKTVGMFNWRNYILGEISLLH